jgi:UDP-N-acetylmuramyl pentapeptide phosphotransferase/UDP-N-acetylglucosamine-1-phosphate transferase
MIGFAPFNRPVARLFLGDVGSLPIGLLFGWLLILLAGEGHLAAALLLPLYYVADATITLLRRVANGEPFWVAHRSHFYQRALDGGLRVIEVVARVLIVNLALVALAVVTVLAPGPAIAGTAMLAGAILVGGMLILFARGAR